MIYKLVRCCLFLLILLQSKNACAQPGKSDSLQLAAAIDSLTVRHSQALGNEQQVYNGKEYFNHDKYYLRGHQFYASNEEQEGSIIYEGYRYNKVAMLYDIVLEQLVVLEPAGAYLFKLENHKVSKFMVHGHTFIWLATDTITQSSFQAGFYDLLENGQAKLLAKRRKVVFEQPTQRGMEGKFEVADKFYIQKQNKFFEVTKKKSVLNVFPNQKKELQKFIRQQHLTFKKAGRENAIASLVKYYNSQLLTSGN